MPSGVAPCASQRTGTGAIPGWSYTVGADLSLESGAGRGEGVPWDVFIDVDCLRMLAQVVESGESSGTMALKRAFTCVLAACC